MNGCRKSLKTWGGKKLFSYEGSVKEGTAIYYGEGRKMEFQAEIYSTLLKKFCGKEVPIGTSRTDPPKGSLGEWVRDYIGGPAAMSYVGAILIAEGYATRVRPGYIRFHQNSD